MAMPNLTRLERLKRFTFLSATDDSLFRARWVDHYTERRKRYEAMLAVCDAVDHGTEGPAFRAELLAEIARCHDAIREWSRVPGDKHVSPANH